MNSKQKILSGFPKFDNIINGFQNGTLSVIASRPAIGKTAFLLQFAAAQTEEIIYVSLELSKKQLLRRCQTKPGFCIYDEFNIDEIKRKCNENNIRAIFIDYVQLSPFRLGELKSLAIELTLPIICASSLTRDFPNVKQLVGIRNEEYKFIDTLIIMNRPDYSSKVYFDISTGGNITMTFNTELCQFTEDSVRELEK